MRLEQARSEFAVRYYRWAISDARREVSERFRLVRSVKGGLAARTYAYVEGMSPVEQVELLTALIKRYHVKAVELTGERMTARELGIVRAKDEVLRSAIQSEVQSPLRRRMSRNGFAAALKAGMPQVCGAAIYLDSKAGVFRAEHGDWALTTVVNCGKPPSYVQSIRAGERVSLQEAISVLSWLGLGQPTWDLAQKGDEVEAAGAIAEACAHFARTASGLLAGLSIEQGR